MEKEIDNLIEHRESRTIRRREKRETSETGDKETKKRGKREGKVKVEDKIEKGEKWR